LTNEQVFCLGINPLQPAILYACTQGGGVFKKPSAEADWVAVNNGLSELNIISLAINPTTPSTVYIGTFSTGVYKTIDAGASWSPVSTGLPASTPAPALATILSLSINPTSPNTILAGTAGNGVYKSIDGGANWAPSRTGLPDGSSVTAIAFNPVTTTTIYAGTASTGVYKSVDGGATWSATAQSKKVRAQTISQ
jgi:photosystem II stability/assembly factor-like uncharacterized protein